MTFDGTNKNSLQNFDCYLFYFNVSFSGNSPDVKHTLSRYAVQCVAIFSITIAGHLATADASNKARLKLHMMSCMSYKLCIAYVS
jgi:hypothetical protein